MKIEDMEKMASNIRKMIVNAAEHCNGSIHWGGCLSCIEILLSIIADNSNILSLNNGVELDKRDALVISKGHVGLAYYTVLEEVGILNHSFADEFQKNGSQFTEELTMNQELSIECSTGSLGIGFPYAVGLALRSQKKGYMNRVYCVVGDGECDEGSIWEALMLSSQLKLTNLILVVDRNGLQLDGDTRDILDLTNLPDRIASFGWIVREVNGHDFDELRDALLTPRTAPLAVIANTIKGKGISFMENNYIWHDKVLSGKNLESAKEEVGLI